MNYNTDYCLLKVDKPSANTHRFAMFHIPVEEVNVMHIYRNNVDMTFQEIKAQLEKLGFDFSKLRVVAKDSGKPEVIYDNGKPDGMTLATAGHIDYLLTDMYSTVAMSYENQYGFPLDLRYSYNAVPYHFLLNSIQDASYRVKRTNISNNGVLKEEEIAKADMGFDLIYSVPKYLDENVAHQEREADIEEWKYWLNRGKRGPRIVPIKNINILDVKPTESIKVVENKNLIQESPITVVKPEKKPIQERPITVAEPEKRPIEIAKDMARELLKENRIAEKPVEVSDKRADTVAEAVEPTAESMNLSQFVENQTYFRVEMTNPMQDKHMFELTYFRPETENRMYVIKSTEEMTEDEFRKAVEKKYKINMNRSKHVRAFVSGKLYYITHNSSEDTMIQIQQRIENMYKNIGQIKDVRVNENGKGVYFFTDVAKMYQGSSDIKNIVRRSELGKKEENGLPFFNYVIQGKNSCTVVNALTGKTVKTVDNNEINKILGVNTLIKTVNDSKFIYSNDKFDAFVMNIPQMVKQAGISIKNLTVEKIKAEKKEVKEVVKTSSAPKAERNLVYDKTSAKIMNTILAKEPKPKKDKDGKEIPVPEREHWTFSGLDLSKKYKVTKSYSRVTMYNPTADKTKFEVVFYVPDVYDKMFVITNENEMSMLEFKHALEDKYKLKFDSNSRVVRTINNKGAVEYQIYQGAMTSNIIVEDKTIYTYASVKNIYLGTSQKIKDIVANENDLIYVVVENGKYVMKTAVTDETLNTFDTKANAEKELGILQSFFDVVASKQKYLPMKAMDEVFMSFPELAEKSGVSVERLTV